MIAPRRRIVVATADSIGARMAGPAIRASRIAEALGAEHDVRLHSTLTGSDDELRRLVDWCEILVFQGWVLVGRPFLADSDRILVADVYDPMHLEQLEQGREAGDDGRRLAISGATATLNEQLLRGDFFLCASEKQRDLWLGHLASLGRVNARTYDTDDTLRALIDVVPFGVDDEPPHRTGPGAKGVVPGIGADDRVVLWGGGIYNWFDPVSVIRAIDGLRDRHPDVRLLFMGGRHPNPEIPEMRVAVEARRLAGDLGLLDRHVFFNDGWVPFAERQNFLLDADVAVSTHVDHVETAYSFRTRILDYFWAGLPTVATRGDALADLIERRELGVTVPAGDPRAIEDALDRLLSDGAFAGRCRAHALEVASELRWSQVLEPLLAFCRAPARAADLVDPILGPPLAAARRRAGPPPSTGLRHDLDVVRDVLRREGPAALVRRAGGRARRVWLNRSRPDGAPSHD